MLRNAAIAGAFAAALAAALPAAAADIPVDVPAAVPAPAFSPWQIRLRALAVVPDERDRGVFAGGALVPGAGVSVNNAVVPELDITYFFTPNIAAELILGVTRHSAFGTGTIAGLGRLGSTWLLPPTLTLQYHFTNFGAFRPYVGVGANYTFFFNESDGALVNFRLRDAAGFALQAGFDYMITPNIGLNFDVKRLFLNTTATGTLGLGGPAVSSRIRLDPWLIGTGITFRF